MNQRENNKFDPRTPLSQEEIRRAISSSGYPLEVEIYHYLVSAGLHPSIGFRTPLVDGGPTKELDLIARISANHVESGMVTSVAFRSYLAVKRLQEPSVFVGILGARPTPHDHRVLRTYYSTGTPSSGYLDGLGDGGLMQMLHGGSGPHDWMDPLLELPICVHWAVVERRNQEPWAAGDKLIWEDIDLVVRGSHYMARATAEHRVSQPAARMASPLPDIRYDYATVVIDAPTLYLYDPQTRELQSCDWLVLHRMFEVGNGELASRAVDILTRHGLARYVETMKKVVPAIAGRIFENSRALQEGARQQYDLWDARTKKGA